MKFFRSCCNKKTHPDIHSDDHSDDRSDDQSDDQSDDHSDDQSDDQFEPPITIKIQSLEDLDNENGDSEGRGIKLF